MHKNRYSVLPFYSTKGKRSYKSPHTNHTTPHSSLHRWQKDLYWYLQTLPCTAQPREVHKDHTTLQNSTWETQRFTWSVIGSPFFGDEVANTEEYGSLNASLMFHVCRYRVWIQTFVHRNGLLRPWSHRRLRPCFLYSTTLLFYIQTF